MSAPFQEAAECSVLCGLKNDAKNVKDEVEALTRTVYMGEDYLELILRELFSPGEEVARMVVSFWFRALYQEYSVRRQQYHVWLEYQRWPFSPWSHSAS